MLHDDLCVLHIWPVNINCNGSRDFGINIAVVCYLDLMFPLCHEMTGLKEVIITGDLVCHTGVTNAIIGRSICRCYIDRDHRVWHRVRMYDGDRVRMYEREEE
jgi:hypothetical protein